MPLKKKSSQSKSRSAGSKSHRPPIVTIMGHVDHGKTTLLDAIRKSNVISQEHGGITQHIGAYQASFKGKKITFIDTPGHAAFVKMRSRGASATDLVVLVVAADDGVKAQTKESLTHIKQAKVPFLVAINKIDLPQVSVEGVKSQLAENKVLVEGYGGDIVCVEVSAKQKKGIDDLLEMILLLGEMQNLQADHLGSLEGVIIDSKLDARKGPLATVLVRNGTLRVGDQIFAAETEGKVKSMFDESARRIVKAEPSKPVVVLGFKKVPLVGAKVKTEKFTKRDGKTSKTEVIKKTEEKEDKERIKIILKTDTAGTLEAIQSNLSQEVEIIWAGIGQVSDSEVLLALSTGAQIIGFNVKTPTLVKKLAETEKVDIKTYNIIYELLEDLEKRVLKILEPTIDEKTLAEAEIIAEFRIKEQHIAGCRIKKGKINRQDKIHLKRKNKILADAKIKSFQKEKKEIEEAKAGSEVGIVFTPDLDFEIGDVIIAYSNKS